VADNFNLIIEAPKLRGPGEGRALHIAIVLQYVKIDARLVDGPPHRRRRTTPHQHIGQPQRDATNQTPLAADDPKRDAYRWRPLLPV